MNIRLWLILFVIGLIAGLGLYFYFDNRNSAPITKTEYDLTSPAVVKQMQQLQRLETAGFTIEKIIEAKTAGNAFENVLYGDKILLIASGQVLAGFDLSNLSENSVAVKGKSLTIQMPPPQILVTKLDNEKTRVYDRQSGFLTRGDKDLETQARLKAESEIRAAACQMNILGVASDNGRKQLQVLFGTLGFSEVNIEIPEISC